MAVYTVRLQNVSGPDVVSLTDGTTYATLAVNPSVGPRGAGWTGVSYATGTGRFTFTSNDGLGYISDDIRVGLDADLLDGQHGSYYTSYTDTAIANLIDTAPATLDTLNELAAALGDDPNFATTVTNNIATKVSKAGDTMTGNLSFGDNNKAIFGAGSDLQIYHDGTHSYISDTGAGDLIIRGDNNIWLQTATAETMARGDANGAFNLYYDNALRLATTSTGVDVTGTVTADGLVLDQTTNTITTGSTDGSDNRRLFVCGGGSASVNTGGNISVYGNEYSGSGGNVVISAGDALTGGAVDGDIKLLTGPSRQRLTVDQNGDISFYEDTGTTAKLFWDASAESLGIGTSSPSAKFMVAQDLNDTASAMFYNTAGGSGSVQGKGYIGFGISESWNFHGAEIGWDQEAVSGYRQALTFSTRGNSDVRPTERMRIDSSGNLLVGKTSADGGVNGFEARSAGEVYVTATSATPLSVKRNTTDGPLVSFSKDGTTVGSIGNRSGSTSELYIALTTVGTGAGLMGGGNGDAINPSTDSGAINDATVNLGGGTARWKNLYLSGGVYLGGTGAANLLDDYEEGTWTPTVSSGTVSSSYGRYTKIGNRVFVGIEMGGFSDVGSANALTVNNLPFTTGSGASEGSVGGSFSRYCSPIPSAAYTPSASTLLTFYVSGGSGAYYQTLHSHLTSTNARFYVHATYLTA